MQKLLRRVALLLGALTIAPLALLIGWTINTPITWSGAFYVLGSSITSLGALTAPWRREQGKGLIRVGIGLIVGTAAIRVFVVPTSPTLRVIAAPDARQPQWLNHLIDEQDVALFGARVLNLTGIFLTPNEAVDVVPALHAAYRRMRESDGTAPSPFARTYLGGQQPDQFDLVIADPGHPSPKTAVVFLHGFSGNFTVQCWLIANAAREIGAVTVCPSTGWRGDWWLQDGEATVRTTLDMLRQQGITRIYMAGLSNGAVGASRLASGFNEDVVGLILISGADVLATQTKLPLLLVQGEQDERMPTALAQQVARQAGSRATYVGFEGDHFVLAKRADDVRSIIARWLAEQEHRAP